MMCIYICMNIVLCNSTRKPILQVLLLHYLALQPMTTAFVVVAAAAAGFYSHHYRHR